MDFELISNNLFKVGEIDYYNRLFRVVPINPTTIKIVHVISGFVLVGALLISTITIGGLPLISLKQLQDILFNGECSCDSEGVNPDFKYFDLSFDDTFE